jgi:lysophospholipase L1-like esterase
LLLIEAACAATGRPVPRLINAGAGGDSATQAVARMSRDFLAHAPATVVMMTGVNDSLRGIRVDETLAAHRVAAGICTWANCPLAVMSPTALSRRGWPSRPSRWDCR